MVRCVLPVLVMGGCRWRVWSSHQKALNSVQGIYILYKVYAAEFTLAWVECSISLKYLDR
jgi:hypothetical protein